jgi:RNA recognition motif-containing protein
MRSQDSHRSGRRPRSRRPYRGNTASAPQKAAPKSFWQKVVAFFSGEQTSAPAPARSRGDSAPRADRKPSEPRTSRKPEVVEVSSAKLYVGNLSFDATESDLFDLFNGVGEVKNAEIVSHKYTQKSKGFAFVTMQNVEEAKRAVDELHDKEFMGRKLVVSGAKTNEVRDAA